MSREFEIFTFAPTGLTSLNNSLEIAEEDFVLHCDKIDHSERNINYNELSVLYQNMSNTM